MTQFDKCLLLLVRSDHDVPRACREAGAFLAFQRACLPPVHAGHDRKLIGIWVDPLMVDAPPEVLGRASVRTMPQFRIRESVGLSGIWLLCWLDADRGRRSADPGAVRESLLSALIEERLPSQHPTTRFAPIFDADDRGSLVHLQTERLRGLFPGLISEPVKWNRTTGAVATLSRNGKGNSPH